MTLGLKGRSLPGELLVMMVLGMVTATVVEAVAWAMTGGPASPAVTLTASVAMAVVWPQVRRSER